MKEVNDFEKELEKFVLNRYKDSDIEKVKKYFILSKGKRIRPLICFEIAKHYRKDINLVMPIAIALELIHSASLAFDDLPFIDNAEKRRNKLTTHKKYNTMIAVFAGSSAVLDGIRLITEVPSYNAELKNKLVQLFTDNLTEKGLIGSQELELGFSIKKIKTMLKLYEMKASSLFKIACVGSAMVCNASKKELSSWNDFARHFGLVFQIRDDFLDYSKKDIGKDKQKEKFSIIKKIGKLGAELYLNKEKKKCFYLLKEINVGSNHFNQFIK